MAEEIDILTYIGCWIGALLLTIIIGAISAVWAHKKKNLTSEKNRI